MPITVNVEPLQATLGAVVRGVDLGALTGVEWTGIHAAFLKYAVLVFPGQHLTDDEQKAFGARFGAFEPLSQDEGLASLTNRRRDGSLREADDPVMHILKGNEGWHTDSSYMPLASKASMLSAHVVPTSGGQTQWADMRAAYDVLAESVKERVTSLSAYHSILYAQSKLGFNDAPEGSYGYSVDKAPLRPLVKVHPETGRKALFIGRHAHAIPGLSPEESDQLLADLMEQACQSPRTYEHQWSVGDLVVWDNRCVLHRARPWNLDEPRLMKHTRIKGEPASEGVLVA